MTKRADNQDANTDAVAVTLVGEDSLTRLKAAANGTSYWYEDSETGEAPGFEIDRQLTEIHMEGRRGAVIAYEWDYWSLAYGLDGVSEDELNGFEDTVGLWKKVRASVDFKTHKVAPGDTLPGIALQFYRNADLAMTIFYANADMMTNPDVLPRQDTRLRVPNIRTYTVAAGDTLASIAAPPCISDDAAQLTTIFTGNRDILKNPNAVAAGQVLRIPDLPLKAA